MSRLDSFINRLLAQREALNQVQDEVLSMPGPVVEMGLGGWRTYDHLVSQYGADRIIVFDRGQWPRDVNLPNPLRFIEGEIRFTYKQVADLNAALIHIDIGTRSKTDDSETLEWLAEVAVKLSAVRGLVICGLPLEHPQLVEHLLENVPTGRYYLYRKKDLNRG